jgi:hypothetical protein
MRRLGLIAVGCVLCDACVVDTVDLRQETDAQAPGDPRCGWRERFDPLRGTCVLCSYRLPHPLLACPCAWEYVPAPLPYCDTDDAYYDCLPCKSDISACNAYDTQTKTSNNCSSLVRCCDELETAPGATPCCETGLSFECVYDAAASRDTDVFRAGCVAKPCCFGVPCPDGTGDCAGFQTCVDGLCTPACEPSVEECAVVASQGSLTCLCVDVGIPP